MIRDYFLTIQKYNIIGKKINNKNKGYYYYEKIKNLLKEKYNIDLSDTKLAFSPLYPDGSLGEPDWIYNLFIPEDFENFKPIKIAVINDKELPPIKIGKENVIEFVTIPDTIFNEVLKKVIKNERKGQLQTLCKPKYDKIKEL